MQRRQAEVSEGSGQLAGRMSGSTGRQIEEE